MTFSPFSSILQFRLAIKHFLSEVPMRTMLVGRFIMNMIICDEYFQPLKQKDLFSQENIQLTC